MKSRALFWHPESECLWEVRDEAEIAELRATGGDGLVEEVTGEDFWEAALIRQSAG